MSSMPADAVVTAPQPDAALDIDDDALVRLGRLLLARDYSFTTVTPATHARRLLARGFNAQAHSLRDVFGWNLPFALNGVFAEVAELLDEAGALHTMPSRHRWSGTMVRSGVRFANVGGHLFVHGSYPTDAADAVFLGPDTIRFCRLLDQRTPGSIGRVLDVGAGSGAAGIMLSARASQVVLADMSHEALRMSRINAAIAGLGRDVVDVVDSDGLRDVDGLFDVIVCNPPYLADPLGRTYRHGGSMGTELAVRFVEEALQRLTSTGRLIVYAGTPFVDGRDLFRDAVTPLLGSRAFSYGEIDPDVFGEEIGEGAYLDVERIAVVALEVHA